MSNEYFYSSDNMPLISSDVCDMYTYKVKCCDEVMSTLISQTADVNLLGQSIASSQSQSQVVLLFKILFAPSKSFQYVIIF